MLLLFWLLSTHIVEPYEKMISVCGKVISPNAAPSTIPMSLSTCLDDCYKNSQCLLSFLDSNGYCSFHYRNSTNVIIVEEVDEAENQIAGFKCEMPDNSCPKAFVDVIMKVPNDNSKWLKSGKRWTLIKCRDGWELFQRPGDIFVCMKFFETKFGEKRPAAQNTCNQNGAKLSGVANRKESEWMEKQAEHLNTGAWDGAWLDGVRSCDASEPNCHVSVLNVFKALGFQNYLWSDGFTSGNDAFGWNLWSPNDTATEQSCLTALSISSRQQRLNAVSCEKYDRAVGVICGYQLE